MVTKSNIYLCVEYLKDGSFLFKNTNNDSFYAYGNGYVVGLWYEYRNNTLMKIDID